MGRLAVIVPLRSGVSDEVLELLRDGPPVHVERLARFYGFITPGEAILCFEGPAAATEDPVWRDLVAWRLGDRWERSAAGPARVAEGAGSWERAPDMEGFFFGPLPGPGDSEGSIP
jgi:hypothetical protein